MVPRPGERGRCDAMVEDGVDSTDGAVFLGARRRAVGVDPVRGGRMPRSVPAYSNSSSRSLDSRISSMPTSSSASRRWVRIAQATSSRWFAVVRATMRSTTPSAVTDSSPHSSGVSVTLPCHSGIATAAFAAARRSGCSCSTSAEFGTVTSTIARDQPCDRLPTRVSSPLRTYQSTPFTSRICVTRMPTASTTPVARSVSTMSPTPSWSSATMNSPVSTSFTRFCAPKPSPAPSAAVISENAPVICALRSSRS